MNQLLSSHPGIGIFLSGTFLSYGSAIPYAVHVPDEIPQFWMQMAQLTFWGAGVLLALLTYRKKK